ncbi:hypothetical protein [Natronoarchaeum rubrum]|uniref:hypothetical protein n=1 Tax=Natronoarchaeum rubrum TaxID=755311 RepID=UPI0021126480|nr:hypothetical protein [Natronoarchaeum rubrum]
MALRRLLGTVVGYAFLAVAFGAALGGLAMAGSAVLGGVSAGKAFVTLSLFGLSMCTWFSGYFLLRATRGTVLPIDPDRSPASIFTRGGGGGGGL